MAKGIMANSIVNAAAGMLLLITGFVCSIILARLLGPDANGIVAFSLWLAMTGSLVAELGTGIILLRMLQQLRAQGYDSERRRGFAAFLVMPTVVSTVVLAFLYGLVFLGSEELHWAETAPSIALVTGVLFIVQSIGAFAKNYLIGEQRLGTFFRLTLVASALQLATVLLGAIYFGVEGALVGYALGQGSLFLYTLTIIFHRRDRCDIPTKVLISSSLVLSAEFIVDSIFLNRLEILFLQQFWSVEVVGYYAVSLSLANLALQLPVQLTGSLLPYYAERRHGDDQTAVSSNVFSSVIRALSYITLPMSFGLAAISTDLVVAVFGEAFRPAGIIVFLMAASAPAYVLTQILTQYLFSIDKAKSRLIVGLIAAAVLVVGCLALVPWLGGEGAAIVRGGVMLLMCVLMLRETGFGGALSGLYRTLVKVMLASFAIALIAAGILEVLHGFAGLLVAIAAAAAVYPAALRLMRAVPAEDRDALLAMTASLPQRGRRLAERFVLFVSPYPAAERDEKARPGELPGSSAEPVQGAGRKAALPVVFDGTVGLYMPEDQDASPRAAAVLILPPWGFEEMCTRKFFRILAEQMAEQGMSSLRFDYPGTGDALDVTDRALHLADWEASVIAAAHQLKTLSGRKRIVIVGQGLGCLLAARVAPRIPGIEAIAMLAPVVSGRNYLREVALWSKVVDQGLGLREDQRDLAGVKIASLAMPDAVAAELKSVSIARPEAAHARRYLVLERPVRITDTSLADALRELGAEVCFDAFEGYDDLVANPTIQKMPMRAAGRILEWLSEVNPCEAPLLPPVRSVAPGQLVGPDFQERPLRFGRNEHLFGTICVPKGRQPLASVLILTTAYDRNAGWGRMSVGIARALAAEGIASFRYDTANVADSPPAPGVPAQVLYSPSQTVDVIAAIDLIERQVGGDILVAGRCSGGYLALRTAVADGRIKGVITVNPFVFYWDPRKEVDAGLQFVPRSLDYYGQRLASLETVRRVLAGDVNLRIASKNLCIALARRLLRRFEAARRRVPGADQIHTEVLRTFRLFRDRRMPVSLIYSEGDIGIDDMRLHFGDAGEGLAGFGNVMLTMLPDTDHNITPEASRQVVYREIARLAREGRDPSVAERVEEVLHLGEKAG